MISQIKQNYISHLIVGLSAIFLLQFIFVQIPVIATWSILVMILFFLYPQALLKWALFFLLIFQMIYLLSPPEGEPTFWPIRTSLFLLIFQISFFLMYYASSQLMLIKKIKLFHIIILFINITCIITIIISLLFPNAVRTIYVYGDAVTPTVIALRKFYQMIGIMSYGFGHAISVIPIILLFIGSRIKTKRLKYYYLVSSILVFITMFVSTITTAFFLSLLGYIIAYIYLQQKNKFITIFSIVLILLFYYLLADIFIVEFLTFIKPFAAGTLMENKVDSILSVTQGLGSREIEIRNELHQISKDTFFSHPFWGMHSKEAIGGHSFFYDFLAFFGILGFAPLIIFLFSTGFHFLKRRIILVYIISIFPLVGLAFIKGFPANEYFFMLIFFVPFSIDIYRTLSQKINKKNHENNPYPPFQPPL